MKGIFGSMFDLNHDGNISPLESAMEFTFLNELLKDDSEVQTELELSGLDPDELILSILVYTLFSRMFDLMQPPAVKHSIAVV